MARPASKHPTELELEILKVIWREGPLPVSRVRDELAGFRDLAVTSVTTVMNIMVRKGYLKKSKSGGSFVYTARVSEAATARRMLKDVVDRVFDGSAAALVAGLLKTADLDEAELREIQGMLDRQKGDQP
jgi:predicted transcriptional regulator